MRALLVLAFVANLPRPADACIAPRRSVFQIFDEAEIVAFVSASTGKDNAVLHVITTLKGNPGKSIEIDLRQATTCSPGLIGDGIIMLPKERLYWAGQNSDVFQKRDKIVAALTTYAAAKTAAARGRVLVDFIVKTDIRFDAGLALGDDPEALVTLTAKDRARLLSVMRHESVALPFLLARLGVDAKQLEGDAAELATNRVFEKITDKNELADIIAATPKGASPRAAAALERCERLRKKRLAPFFITVKVGAKGEGLDWKRLADACRN